MTVLVIQKFERLTVRNYRTVYVISRFEFVEFMFYSFCWLLSLQIIEE